MCGLVTMTKQSLSTHVIRCCGKKSMYQGAQGGRPAHLAEDAQLMHIMDAAKRKSERTCLKLPDEMKQVLQLAQASLKARGRTPLPKSFAYPRNSKTIKKFRKNTGTAPRKGGRDNSARARALASPRSLIYNFAGLLSLADARWTHDHLPVHFFFFFYFFKGM